MSKQCNTLGFSVTERVAVFTSYGTHEHVECIGVVIQDGGTKSGGKVRDSRNFWLRDYPSGEGMFRAALAWAMTKGAQKMAQMEEVMPIEDCKSGFIWTVN